MLNTPASEQNKIKDDFETNRGYDPDNNETLLAAVINFTANDKYYLVLFSAKTPNSGSADKNLKF